MSGYEAITVGGIGAPKGTPVEIIEKLNKEINAGLANPTLKARVCRRVTVAAEILMIGKANLDVVADADVDRTLACLMLPVAKQVRRSRLPQPFVDIILVNILPKAKNRCGRSRS